MNLTKIAHANIFMELITVIGNLTAKFGNNDSLQWLVILYFIFITKLGYTIFTVSIQIV